MTDSNKTKILVLCSTYPRWPGDTTPGFVEYLCEQLSTSFEIHVLAPHCKGAKTRELFKSIHIHRFKYAPGRLETLAYGGGILENIKKNPFNFLLIPLFFISQLYNLAKLNNKYNYDIFHAHWIIPQGLSVAIYKSLLKNKIKYLLTSHGGDLYSFQKGILNRIRHYILNRADKITVVSNAMKETCLDLGCLNTAVEVVPMGVHLKSIFCLPDEQTRIDKSIIFVGRLADKKGVKYLVKAFKHILKHHTTAKLIIIGDGPLKQSLEELSNSLNLQHHIIFHGAIKNSNIPAFLQRSSIAVIPSIQSSSGDQEGLGLTIVEAMGCGCAVVASSLPAIHDVVIDNVTGLLSKPGDPTDIANKVCYLFDNPLLIKKFSDNGRQHVVNNFDWEYIGKKYQNILNDLESK